MPTGFPPILDADGHVIEDHDAIWTLIGEPYIGDRTGYSQSAFPQLDHLHTPSGKKPPDSFDFTVKMPQWLKFAEALGVLYTNAIKLYGLKVPSPA